MNKSITDEKIIAVLLASDTRKKACKTLGIKEQTLYDRMSKPDFQVKYKQARDEIITDVETDIQGYDLDPEMIEIARINAKKAGVDHMIHFQARDIADLSHRKKYGSIRQSDSATRSLTPGQCT